MFTLAILPIYIPCCDRLLPLRAELNMEPILLKLDCRTKGDTIRGGIEDSDVGLSGPLLLLLAFV